MKKNCVFLEKSEKVILRNLKLFLEGVFVQVLNSIEFALRLVELELERAQARTQKLSLNVGLTKNKTEVQLGPSLNFLKAC